MDGSGGGGGEGWGYLGMGVLGEIERGQRGIEKGE